MTMAHLERPGTSGPILQSHDIYLRNITDARDCEIIDRDGNRWIDYESGIWCTALGHNHPRVTAAITAQLDRVMHLNNRTIGEVSETAARDLLAVTGHSGGKCVFLCSGSEAVEFGVQAVRRITAKPLVVTLRDSYLAAYGSAGRQENREWVIVDGSTCPGCPHPDRCETDCPALAGVPFDEIGGFVLEPGSSSGLVRFPPEPLVAALARIVQGRGGLVLANEVTTGMGRTGRWFGFRHYPITPDIVAIGKGLGNGYPVSAVSLTAAVANALEAGHFHYAQSHQNDPLGCAVAREVLAVMGEEDLVARSARVGGWFRQQLAGLQAAHPLIRDVRGRGLMVGVELDPACGGGEPAVRVHRRLLEKGRMVGVQPQGNVIRLLPALTMARHHLEDLVVALDLVLAHLVEDTASNNRQLPSKKTTI